MSGTTTAEGLETFSTEDLESFTLEEGSLEEIAEELEEESLEDLEDLEFAGESTGGQEALPLVAIGKFAGKHVLRAMLKVAKRLIMRMASNPVLKRRIVDAVKRGGRPVFCRLLCQAVCRNLPPFLRPLCNRLCPVVCQKVWPFAVRRLGLPAG